MRFKSKRNFFSVIILIIVLLIISMTGIKSGDDYVFAPLYTKVKQGLDLKGGVYVVYEADTDVKGDDLSKIINQTIEVFRKRIDGIGLTEPLIVREGENRIRIELPGVSDVNDAISTIGKTAQLSFIDSEGNVVLDGSHISDSQVATDSRNGYVVTLKFNEQGTKLFAEATKKAVVTNAPIYIVLDDTIISAPNVQSEILGGSAEISGNFDAQSATELASLIRAGALPVDFIEVESSTKSAQLGDDALRRSINGAAIGITLVMLFMLIFYKIPGLIADIALLAYMLIFMFIYTSLGATLTLPGIAALILSVGMAVDANVIIFERIKEELRDGKTVKTSIKNGFGKALTTIMDSQITTIIAGVVLYSFGTGPIKGFAVTLIIGILISLFTAIVVTKFLFQNLIGFTDIKNMSLLGLSNKTNVEKLPFKFVEKFKISSILSVSVICIGLILGFSRGFNMGIDFTGGTTIEINMHKFEEHAKLLEISHGFDNTSSVDYLGEDKAIIQIKTTKNLDDAQRNEVFNAYKQAYNLNDEDFVQSGYIGAAIGEEIQRKALISIFFASICMLIYITFRFKYTFGISAIIALLHDVLVVLAVYAIFNVPVNSPFVAAILTVVGYSINDTIVVFDRIRENKKIIKRTDDVNIANISINQTIKRSINTSVTTLLSILSLYLLGVESIREFTFPLLVGILSGTYSSLFIASPLWVMFEKSRKK